jgi:hypothetical protein
MVDDFVCDDVKMETYLFGVWHGGVVVEICKVDSPKLCPQCTDGGIDKEVDRGEIGVWCAFVVWIVNAIATNGEPNAMFLIFLWLIIVANVAIGGLFVSWNV